MDTHDEQTTPGRRYRLFRIARVSEHVCWWVFVIATVMAGGVYRFDSGGWRFGAGTGYGRGDFGWVAYNDLAEYRHYADYVLTDGSSDVLVSPAFYGALTLVAVVLAAVIEAFTVRRIPAGLLTVGAPVIAAAGITFATSGGWNVDLSPIPALILTLAAVAVREIWARALVFRA